MIKDFQRAITHQDWDTIIRCWEILSGETYKPIDLKPIEKIPAVCKKAPAKKKPKSRGAAATMNPVVTRRNKFEEMIPNLKVTVDAGYDKVNDNVPLTPRNRTPFRTKTVTCECGVTQDVAPLFARPDWKCEKCSFKRNKGR